MKEKKKNRLITILIFLLAFGANAQDPETELEDTRETNSVSSESSKLTKFFTPKSVSGKLLFGQSNLDLGGINSTFESNEYSKLDDKTESRAFTLQLMNDYDIIFGLEFSKVSLYPPGRSGYDTDASAGYFLLNFGYAFFTQTNFRVYPLLGVGAGRLDMIIVQEGTPTFDEVFSNPNRATALSTKYSLFNTGIGIDYLIKLSEFKSEFFEKLALTLSAQGGYLHMSGAGEWLEDGRKRLSGSKAGVDGSYFHLGIGIGVFR